jgi:hypothetical protein
MTQATIFNIFLALNRQLTFMKRILHMLLNKDIFVAVIALVGVLVGALLSELFQNRHWEQEKAFQKTQAILNKRIELIERTLVVFNKGANEGNLLRDDYRLIDTMMQINLRLEMMQVKSKAGKSSPKIVNSESDELYKRALENRKSQIAIANDVAIVMSLDRFYFGPQTSKIIDTLIKHNPIWEADSALKVRFLDVMNQELSYGLTKR